MYKISKVKVKKYVHIERISVSVSKVKDKGRQWPDQGPMKMAYCNASSNIISPLSYVQFAPSHKILHIARKERRIYIKQFSPKCIHTYVQQFYMFPNPKNTTQSNDLHERYSGMHKQFGSLKL